MKALEASVSEEDRYRLMVEAAPQAMIVVDADGRMIYVNARTESLFDYPRQFLLGQSIDMLLPDEVRERHPEMRATYMKSPGTRAMGAGRDLYGQTSDGRKIPLEVGLNPIKTDSGIYVIASIIDISERKRQESALHDQAARIRAIVETAVDSIIVIDPVGTIETVNPATEDLFGYKSEELCGQNIAMLMPDPHRSAHDGYLDHYRRTGERKVIGIGRVASAQRKDGSIFPIELAVSEMRIAGQRKYTGIIRDITERKKAEAQLQAQIEETQQALQRLRDTQAQLVQSERLASLGGLVAGIAHEVNTPIGVGVTAASFLSDQVDTIKHDIEAGNLTKSRFNSFLEHCQESSDILLNNLQRAADLVQSFKKVAVDQSSDEHRKIGLAGYIDELLTSLRPKYKHTGHRIEVDCDNGIEMDTVPGALSQVLTNLIVNSLTHAFLEGENGVMTIAADQDAEGITLTYSDDGQGIPEQYLSKIFDPFFTTKRGQGGSGLGLHIVFSLVHQTLGGHISVHSSPDAGTKFTIRLPRSIKAKTENSPTDGEGEGDHV